MKTKNTSLSLWSKFWLAIVILGCMFILTMVCLPKKVIHRINLSILGPGVPAAKVEPKPDPTWNRLGTFNAFLSRLESFKDDPDIGEDARDIVVRAGEYRSFLTQNLVRLDGASIDCIGQSHVDDFGSNNLVAPMIVTSQEKIKDFLGLKFYGLVAKEGMTAARLDKDSLDRENYDAMMRAPKAQLRASISQRFGIDFSTLETYRRSPTIARDDPSDSRRFKNDGAMLHGLENPNVVFGAEDFRLIAIHHTIFELMSGTLAADDPRGQAFVALEPLVSRMRLEYTYAKLVDRMRSEKAETGAIVFGFHHMGQFRELAAKLGQNSMVYDFSGSN